MNTAHLKIYFSYSTAVSIISMLWIVVSLFGVDLLGHLRGPVGWIIGASIAVLGIANQSRSLYSNGSLQLYSVTRMRRRLGRMICLSALGSLIATIALIAIGQRIGNADIMSRGMNATIGSLLFVISTYTSTYWAFGKSIWRV